MSVTHNLQRRLTTFAFIILSSVFITCFLTACGANSRETVIIVGSTSVQPYLEVLAEEYALTHPDCNIDIQGGGSSAGITAVETGTSDIGMSSRKLNDNEKHLWTIDIAKDGLAIIINPNNPIGSLTIDQIRDIYSGKITNWDELGGNPAKIHLIAREDGSGTRSAFEDLAMGDVSITPKAIVQDSNGAVRLLVADDINAIGFISLGLVNDTVKALRIGNVEATWENVLNGKYSLYRSFLLVANTPPTGDFIDFILSAEGQRILINEGLIPITEGIE